MFTFKKGDQVIAEIDDGKKEKLVYIAPDEEVDEEEIDYESKWNIATKAVKELSKEKSISSQERDKLITALVEKDPPSGLRMKKLYEDAKLKTYESEGKSIGPLRGAKLTPLILPRKDEVQMHNINIFGASGSGKSTFVNKCLRKILEFHPKAKFYVFSRKEEDDSLEKGIEKNIIKIPCDESFIEENFQIEDFAGSEKNPSYLIFDDYERIADLNVRKAVAQFLSTAIEIARQYFIHFFIIRHEVLTGMKTRNLISESTGLVVFPSGSPRHQVETVCMRDYGLNKIECNNLFKLNSRWVMIRKNVPRMVLHERGMYML